MLKKNLCVPVVNVCLYHPRILPLLLGAGLMVFACHSGAPADDRSPENALSTFTLQEGFEIELVAGEPLVADPVAMEIDEHGRLYVVEMHGYPLDLSGSGKVKRLTDTDGDGKMDQSVIFADSLVMPTGIMRWKQGLIVTDPPNVYYLEDSDGDGKADIKDILLTGFALSNPQHNVNTPKLALDNWIYLGHEPSVTTTIYEDKFGDKGTDVYFPERPDINRLPQNAGGRSIRFKPDTYELELLSSRTQFGHTADAFGHRFLVNNSNHIIQEVLSAEYLQRNPYLVITEVTQSSSDHGSGAEVYPITINPQHQLLTDLGVMTSACGLTAYLGGAFPERYHQATFVSEPVSNIVHVDLIKEDGTGFIASREHPDKEFLASTDAWFRPVNAYVGPDGALYIVDYYRQIIEHPEWMAEEVVQSGALYNGTDKGRIYRISSKGSQPIAWSDKLKLGNASPEELMGYLSHENAWWRMNAQRLLLDQQPPALIPALKELAVSGEDPMGRLHALWTLQGMDALDQQTLSHSLKDPVPGIRENAIKLSEFFLASSPELTDLLLTLKDDPDPKVRFQLIQTLGYVESEPAFLAREELLFRDIDDKWVQLAALSAPFSESSRLITPVLDQYTATPAYNSLVQKLASMVGSSMDEQAIFTMVHRAVQSNTQNEYNWQPALLRGLAEGIKSKKLEGAHEAAAGLLASSVFDHPSPEVKAAAIQVLEGIGLEHVERKNEALSKAKAIAQNQSLSGEERSIGIRFLALGNIAEYQDMLVEMVEVMEPLPVQLAAFRALSKSEDSSFSKLVIDRWESFTPELRDAAVSAMMMNGERITVLLTALEDGLIQKATIGWRRSVGLMANKDETLRVRARAILTRPEGESEKIIETYQPALELQGTIDEGAVVFRKNCAICHQMGEEQGIAFGPDLSSLKNRRPASIMMDILNPNLSIADGYDLWEVELQNGELHQGLISSETPTAINLRNAGGIDRNISRTNIKTLKLVEMSAMPTGLEQGISVQEMADLLAYIRKAE
ncbi:putative membrane-bound dehydrogenase domain-containing protein [Cyclobacterium lianum]|uniref:Putative membrane-bound dehydrogenase domain-containing protein n=1 Tax=Cyclobacterium lianum TaxID=388280 RepID=A0A1M7PYN1_9BACT|nr:PVC-type heme-binding CxxCH protein [Cyclobacterium lianum]SHN22827.1 putative membrane-bound dehydrogenase domain-containing protein [Cyclobacterium lianum]